MPHAELEALAASRAFPPGAAVDPAGKPQHRVRTDPAIWLPLSLHIPQEREGVERLRRVVTGAGVEDRRVSIWHGGRREEEIEERTGEQRRRERGIEAGRGGSV